MNFKSSLKTLTIAVLSQGILVCMEDSDPTHKSSSGAVVSEIDANPRSALSIVTSTGKADTETSDPRIHMTQAFDAIRVLVVNDGIYPRAYFGTLSPEVIAVLKKVNDLLERGLKPTPAE